MEEPLFRVGQRDIKIQSTKLEGKSYCPSCGGGPLDGATGIGDSSDKEILPEEGSPTVCLYCSAILVFGENLTVQLPTNEQTEKLKSNSQVWNALCMLQVYTRLVREKSGKHE